MTGCKGVVEGVDESLEPVKVKFEDSESRTRNGGAKGLGHSVHRCDTTKYSRVSRWIDLVRIRQTENDLHAA